MRSHLTFQDYLTYYSTGCSESLTISHLKKILRIHGFAQLGNSSKEDLMAAVRSLDITPPVRSTTKTNFVPRISLHAASISVRELTMDMQDIGWKEWPFQSLLTIEPKVPAMSRLSFVELVPQTIGKLKENDQGAPLIRAMPCLKFPKKARSVVNKRADKYSWRSSGFMNINDLPDKNSEKAWSVVKKHTDKYSWRLCGSKNINGLPYSRHYYKCRNADCCAKKYIDRDANDPLLLIANYNGKHNHTPD